MSTVGIAVIARLIFLLEVPTPVKRKITECTFYQVSYSNVDFYERYLKCKRRYVK